MGVLAVAAGLLDVAVFVLDASDDRLTVRDLGRADGRIHAELATQPVDDDFQVKLAHA